MQLNDNNRESGSTRTSLELSNLQHFQPCHSTISPINSILITSLIQSESSEKSQLRSKRSAQGLSSKRSSHMNSVTRCSPTATLVQKFFALRTTKKKKNYLKKKRNYCLDNLMCCLVYFKCFVGSN